MLIDLKVLGEEHPAYAIDLSNLGSLYRDIGNGRPYRYDTLEGFAREWSTGAFGVSWRDTPEGKRLLDRFTN